MKFGHMESIIPSNLIVRSVNVAINGVRSVLITELTLLSGNQAKVVIVLLHYQ